MLLEYNFRTTLKYKILVIKVNQHYTTYVDPFHWSCLTMQLSSSTFLNILISITARHELFTKGQVIIEHLNTG